MQVVEIGIDELVPYDANPRNNQSAVEYVANSIREFGFKVPIVVDGNNVIVAGHTRYLAAKQLGMESVPCIIASDLTPEQVKAFRIADNKTAEQSDWNMLKLSKEILDLDFDLGDFGFSEIEVDNLVSLGNDFFGRKDDPEPTFTPQVYTPNTAPTESKAVVSEQQVQKAELQQATKFTSGLYAVAAHRVIICPHCGEEFEID